MTAPNPVDPFKDFRSLVIPAALRKMEDQLINANTVTVDSVDALYKEGAIYFIDPTSAAADFGSGAWQANSLYQRRWNALLRQLIVARIGEDGLNTVMTRNADQLMQVLKHPHDDVVQRGLRHILGVLRYVVWGNDWR